MNQQQRDEMRAKHHVGQNEADDQCQSCFRADGYPCDVIKVLDALEAVANINPDNVSQGEQGVDARESALNSRTQMMSSVDARERVTSTDATTSECEHANLPTMARLREMGVPCPLCEYEESNAL